MATSYENKQSSKANKQVCVPAAAGCGKHTQLTAAFMLAGLGASLPNDQHPPRDRDISAASAHTPGTHHHHSWNTTPSPLTANASVNIELFCSSIST